MDKNRVIDLVRQAIEKHLPPAMERPFAIQIDADGAWEEEDWWHVPVWPDRDVPRTYMYYDVLAEAEVELQDVEDLNVILIPTAPKAPAVD